MKGVVGREEDVRDVHDWRPDKKWRARGEEDQECAERRFEADTSKLFMRGIRIESVKYADNRCQYPIRVM